MTKVEFVSVGKYRKTLLKKNWRQERRPLSTIPELSEQEISEFEIKNSEQENANYLPDENPHIVTIGSSDIMETVVGTTTNNSPIGASATEQEHVAIIADNNMSLWWVQKWWVEHFSVSGENSPVTVAEEQVAENVCSISEWVEHFTIDQFLFSLFLGLIPTAWDVFSDLRFGEDLTATNQISAAGDHNLSTYRKMFLSYFVCKRPCQRPLSDNAL